MEIKVTKKLLKLLESNGLDLTTWSFLLSLYNKEDLYDLEDAEKYSFISQKLGVLGYIKLCDDNTDELFCMTDAGYDKITEINQNTE